MRVGAPSRSPESTSRSTRAARFVGVTVMRAPSISISLWKVARARPSRKGSDARVVDCRVPRSELADAVVVDFPLRGEWTAVQSPATRIPSHGTDVLAQRYAFDLQRLDDRGWLHPSSRLRTLAAGVPLREAYGWGESVHAVADGEVLVA